VGDFSPAVLRGGRYTSDEGRKREKLEALATLAEGPEGSPAGN
jgi:hypothetical protein